jgi:hypothetical protein
VKGCKKSIRLPISLLPFCAGLLFAGDTFAFEVVAAEFGLFDASDPQWVVFSPAAVVPRREGRRYGWMIELRGAPRSVGVREESLSPSRATGARAETESEAGATLPIPLERRRQVSQRQLVPVDGRIFGEWSLGAREPPGPRRLAVIVEGRVAADFEFDVR